MGTQENIDTCVTNNSINAYASYLNRGDNHFYTVFYSNITTCRPKANSYLLAEHVKKHNLSIGMLIDYEIPLLIVCFRILRTVPNKPRGASRRLAKRILEAIFQLDEFQIIECVLLRLYLVVRE